MTTWHIVLDAKPGTGVKVASPAIVQWDPVEPSSSFPIKKGDEIVVHCWFGNYPYSLSTYYNLHIGAGRREELKSLESDIDDNDPHHQLKNITQNADPGPNDYCTNARYSMTNLTREGETGSIINQWSFNYNPGTKVADIKKWVFAFSFGDPHVESTEVVSE